MPADDCDDNHDSFQMKKKKSIERTSPMEFKITSTWSIQVWSLKKYLGPDIKL